MVASILIVLNVWPIRTYFITINVNLLLIFSYICNGRILFQIIDSIIDGVIMIIIPMGLCITVVGARPFTREYLLTLLDD